MAVRLKKKNLRDLFQPYKVLKVSTFLASLGRIRDVIYWIHGPAMSWRWVTTASSKLGEGSQFA